MFLSKEDVLEFISGLSVLELSELVKEFEEKFGVSAEPVGIINVSDEDKQKKEVPIYVKMGLM